MRKSAIKKVKTPVRKSVKKTSNNDEEKKKVLVSPSPKKVSSLFLCINYT
jgi:hypothetical protein